MNNKQLEKIRKGDYLLLPHYMKWVGIVPIVLGVILFFTQHEYDFLSEEVLVGWSANLILLGLMLIILSKDSFPDERLLQLRHKAMAYAFMNGMLVVVLVPLINFTSSSLLQWKLVPYFTDFGLLSVFIFQVMYLINYWRFKQEL